MSQDKSDLTDGESKAFDVGYDEGMQFGYAEGLKATTVPAPAHQPQVGDVFQINESHGRAGWIGAFVLATEIKSWGIQGFVHVVKEHEESARAYIRLNWEHIDYIGRAALIPSDEVSP
jgi:hypothetical protein